MKAAEIKKLQHKLYAERLRKIEAGLIQPTPFAPTSDFGKLIPSKLKVKIKL